MLSNHCISHPHRSLLPPNATNHVLLSSASTAINSLPHPHSRPRLPSKPLFIFKQLQPPFTKPLIPTKPNAMVFRRPFQSPPAPNNPLPPQPALPRRPASPRPPTVRRNSPPKNRALEHNHYWVCLQWHVGRSFDVLLPHEVKF